MLSTVLLAETLIFNRFEGYVSPASVASTSEALHQNGGLDFLIEIPSAEGHLGLSVLYGGITLILILVGIEVMARVGRKFKWW